MIFPLNNTVDTLVTRMFGTKAMTDNRTNIGFTGDTGDS